MWLKEEFIGLEECFKLTHQVMDAFAQAMIDTRDSSIEQYLLNFWTKDLSLRDLIDRIQATTRLASQLQTEIFNILFSWIVNSKILQDQIAWNMEDFRKVAASIAQNVIDSRRLQLDAQEMTAKFIDHAVNKFGAKKVRDFMEI